MKRKKEKTSVTRAVIERINAAILALAVFVLYSVYSTYQWKHFITPSWDLGIFSQLAQEYSHLNLPPIVTIKGPGFDLWGDHFHPILLLLGPIYRIFPSPLTLLYVQNFLVALSAYLLVRFAQKIISTWWSLILGLAYALSFGVQQAVSSQFHEVAFALPFLMMSLGHIVLARKEPMQSHLTRAVLWSLPIAFVKEDLGMTVFMIGTVVLWLSQWLGTCRDILFPLAEEKVPSWKERFVQLSESLKSNRSAARALATMLFGFVTSVLAITVILPAFNTGGVFDYADKIDLPAAIADPLQSLGLMFYPWKKTTTILMLLSTGVIAWLFSPLALVTLPTLAWRFLSPQEGYWVPTWHYSLVLMPMIFMALLDTISKLGIRVREEEQDDAIVHIASGNTQTLLTLRKNLHRILPTLSIIVALAMLPNQPLKDFTNDAFATSKASSTDLLKQEVVDAVPENVSVASDLSVLTYLVPNREVYWIGHKGDPAPDYVIIDQAGTAWGGNPPQNPAQYAADRYQAKYTVVKQAGSIYVIKRVD